MISIHTASWQSNKHLCAIQLVRGSKRNLQLIYLRQRQLDSLWNLHDKLERNYILHSLLLFTRLCCCGIVFNLLVMLAQLCAEADISIQSQMALHQVLHHWYRLNLSCASRCLCAAWWRPA